MNQPRGICFVITAMVRIAINGRTLEACVNREIVYLIEVPTG